MIRLKSLIKEVKHYVYFQKDTLWVAHSPGSGITSYIKDPMNYRGYLSTDTKDSHADHSADRIVDWAKTETPISKKGGTSLYKIPYYRDYRDSEGYVVNPRESKLSIFGGDRQPDAYIWMLVSTMGNGESVINFFKTKQEALGFWSK